MSTLPVISPFKLLQPYGKGDVRIYFGRNNETRQLAEALMRSKFMLLYGASGTGKTSLIQCGLQGMFSPRDWLPIFVRRGNNFIDSLREAVLEQYHIRYQLRYPGREPKLSADIPLREAIKALFSLAYVPVYLILDQFEEIFTLGQLEEQNAFFVTLDKLRLFEEDLFCKLILSTREEYIAHFYRYEKALPFLFEYRFRVEKMRHEQLLEVVDRTLNASYTGYPAFHTDRVAMEQILFNLTDDRGDVDLTTLQVYLDRLYREDLQRMVETNRKYFLYDTALVGENKLSAVLSDFLIQQSAVVNERVFGKQAETSPVKTLQILFRLVTSQGTKQNRSAREIYQELQLGLVDITPDALALCLNHFAAPDVRILNRLRFAKSEEERFEIVHDQLAEQVFAKRNKEESARNEAEETIKIKQKRHGEKPDFLSVVELEQVGNSLNLNLLEKDLRRFFDESRAFRQQQARRRRGITIAAIIASIIFLVVALFAIQQRLDSLKLRDYAEQRTKDFEQQFMNAQKNLIQLELFEYREILQRGKNYEALNSPEYALREYEYAKNYREDMLAKYIDTFLNIDSFPDDLDERIDVLTNLK